MKWLALTGLLLLLTACSHKPATLSVAPAPPPERQPTSATASPETVEKNQPLESSIPSPTEISPSATPLLVETGIASWYGAPYHNRPAANGEIYDMHAMTAAHRTLPLGSLVRVTSLASGQSVTVRITDRGPFIEGRIIDLSQAAAKEIGLLRQGTGEVRIEVLETPQPIANGGRWAVEIGAFGRETTARDLADQLSRRYRTAQVLTFNSPVGNWWIRVRVKDDLRARAEEILRDIKTSEGASFLVRLD
jgi:rare lipoprotein A